MDNETVEITEAVLEATEAVEVSEVSTGVAVEPTATEVQSITVEAVSQVRDDIVHADLFGSFLLCGTLVALALFGRWHK